MKFIRGFISLSFNKARIVVIARKQEEKGETRNRNRTCP